MVAHSVRAPTPCGDAFTRNDRPPEPGATHTPLRMRAIAHVPCVQFSVGKKATRRRQHSDRRALCVHGIPQCPLNRSVPSFTRDATLPPIPAEQRGNLSAGATDPPPRSHSPWVVDSTALCCAALLLVAIRRLALAGCEAKSPQLETWRGLSDPDGTTS